MKNILKKLALLAIPVLLWLAFFIAFEPNNYFGLKASATSSQPVARVRAYQQDPGTNLILGDSRLAHLDMGLVDSLSGQSWQNLAFGGASLKETLDLADYLLDSGHDADTLLVEVSFYTLNAGYNTDRFATLEETLNNPLAYCFNLEYNVNALTVAMDTLRGTPDTIESGDWVAADYLADDGTVLPLHRKHHAALQKLGAERRAVQPPAHAGPALPERGRAAHRSFAADGRQCADRGLRCVRHHRDHAGHGAADAGRLG